MTDRITNCIESELTSRNATKAQAPSSSLTAPTVPTTAASLARRSSGWSIPGLALFLAASTYTLATDPWAAKGDTATNVGTAIPKQKMVRSLREARDHAMQVLLQAERERIELAIAEAKVSSFLEDAEL